MCIWLCKPRQQIHLNPAYDIQLVWALCKNFIFFSPVQKFISLLCAHNTKGRAVAPNGNPGRVGTKREYSLIERNLEVKRPRIHIPAVPPTVYFGSESGYIQSVSFPAFTMGIMPACLPAYLPASSQCLSEFHSNFWLCKCYAMIVVVL